MRVGVVALTCKVHACVTLPLVGTVSSELFMLYTIVNTLYTSYFKELYQLLVFNLLLITVCGKILTC